MQSPTTKLSQTTKHCMRGFSRVLFIGTQVKRTHFSIFPPPCDFIHQSFPSSHEHQRRYWWQSSTSTRCLHMMRQMFIVRYFVVKREHCHIINNKACGKHKTTIWAYVVKRNQLEKVQCQGIQLLHDEQNKYAFDLKMSSLSGNRLFRKSAGNVITQEHQAVRYLVIIGAQFSHLT